MSDLGQWLFQKQKEEILRSVDLRAPRTGVVQAATSTTVTTTDPLTGAAELEPLLVIGQMPAVGERVLIIPLSDGSRVAARLGKDVDDIHLGPPYGGLGAAHLQGGRALYLTTTQPLGTLAGFTLVANRLYYEPVWVPETVTTTGFIFQVTAALSGDVQIGIYTVGTDFLPDARLAQCTKTTFGASGVKLVASGGYSNLPGGRWVMLGLCSTTAMSILGSVVSANLPSLRGGSHQDGSSVYLMCSQDLTAGWSSLPATAAASSDANKYLHVGMLI